MKKLICVIIAAMAVMTVSAGCSDNGGGAGEGNTALSTPAETGAEDSLSTSETAPKTGDEEAADSTAEKIAEKIKSAYGENYLPDTDIPPEMLKSLVGLEEDSYTEIFAQQPMISAHPDILIIVKAARGKTGEVKAKLEAYRSRLVEESFQYPMNIAKVNASKVVANGDYAAFILLGAVNEDMDSSEGEQAKFAEEQVGIGVDAFNEYFS